ncbi:MAG: trypsin-like peptidase domain-containing protein [bacterium]|nr:trypsin-like peptidase domain-containing protein [bacterium]
MSTEPEDPRSEWAPLGWELEGPVEQPGNLPDQRDGEVVAWAPREGPSPPSRNPVVFMLAASVLLAVVGLVGIGIGVGSIFFNRDAPLPEVVVVSGPQVVSAPASAPRLQAPLAEAPSEQPRSDGATGSDQPDSPFVPDDPVVTVARAVIPSVVLIEVNPSRTGQEIPIPPDLDEGVPDSGTEPPGERPRYGQGSGIIYDASGLILTNAHVLGDADAVRVQFADGTRAEGVVVGAAPAIDVGLVRVDTDMALRPAVFADRSTVEVGQLAVAVGSPFGLQQSVTSGIVSAVGRAIREGTGDGAFVEMIQTDAPINPGNSGGALANRFGQVIGMNTLIQTDGQVSGNIGLGFAIPSDIALNIVQRILNGESTDLGYLGVWGTDPEIGEPGALIIEVEPDTPAGEAGLQEGDLIVNIDGEAVSTFTELAAKVQFRVPGTEARLEVVREGAPLEITVVIGSRPVSQQTDGQGEE